MLNKNPYKYGAIVMGLLVVYALTGKLNPLANKPVTAAEATARTITTKQAISTSTPSQTDNAERFWLHPSFNRPHNNGEKANFLQMDKSAVNYYGMRYELPWSLFEKSPGNYIWAELENLLKNARRYNQPTGYKVYIVLHDKTWMDKTPANNNFPVPQDLIMRDEDNDHYFEMQIPARKHTVRTARRWLPEVQKRYIAAIAAIAARRQDNPQLYSPLEVISFGESSLSYRMNAEGMKQLNAEAYFPDPSGRLNSNFHRAQRYRNYWVEMLNAATTAVSRYPLKSDGSTLKIAMNLNWIPGQNGSQPWLQKDILNAVKSNPLAVQAIEDVHVTGKAPLYDQRVYAFSLGTERIVPKNRVWAHLSCDTKHDTSAASENLTQARKMAANIVIREGCYEPVDGNRFADYEQLATQIIPSH